LDLLTFIEIVNYIASLGKIIEKLEDIREIGYYENNKASNLADRTLT